MSSFICFGRAVQGQKFSRRCIHKWFCILVDTDDYLPSDTNALVAQLYRLSKEAEECDFLTEIGLREEFNALDDTWVNDSLNDAQIEISVSKALYSEKEPCAG